MNKHVRAQLISNVLLELHTAQQSNLWTTMYIFHIIPWCFDSLENMIKSCAGSIVNIDTFPLKPILVLKYTHLLKQKLVHKPE